MMLLLIGALWLAAALVPLVAGDVSSSVPYWSCLIIANVYFVGGTLLSG